jgi:hypothetical protein
LHGGVTLVLGVLPERIALVTRRDQRHHGNRFPDNDLQCCGFPARNVQYEG